MKNEIENTNPNPSAASPSGARKKALKVSNKITLLSFSLVALTVTVLTAIV